MSPTEDRFRPVAAREHLALALEEALETADRISCGRVSRAAVPAPLLSAASLDRLLIGAAAEWLAILSAVLLAELLTETAWLQALVTVFIGTRLHALYVLLHDAAHAPLDRLPLRARLLELVAGFPSGTTLRALRYHHLRHHLDSGMRTDPYFVGRPSLVPSRAWLRALRLLFLFPFGFLRAPVGVLAGLFPALRPFYARIFLLDRAAKDPSNAAEQRLLVRDELALLAFSACASAALWLEPERVLRYGVVPMLLASLLHGYRLFRDHTTVSTTDRQAMTLMVTSNDHDTGVFGRLLLAPHNSGYHIVHHLHPQAGHHALPALCRWYRNHHPGLYPTSAAQRLFAQGHRLLRPTRAR